MLEPPQPPSSAPPATPSTVVSTSTTSSPPPLSTAPQLPVFEWVVAPVDAGNRSELASTWREGCPVHFDQLTLVELSHWNYEGEVVTGRLVIDSQFTDAVISVFEQLFAARFPIERMELIEAYGGDDDASMVANNTSAFNCREISGAPGVWSQHAYGGAIDINPLVNPWVQDSRVDPPQGAEYADRDSDVPGLIREGDVVTEAFAAVGWGWGGDWVSSKDYQHFSWNGR